MSVPKYAEPLIYKCLAFLAALPKSYVESASGRICPVLAILHLSVFSVSNIMWPFAPPSITSILELPSEILSVEPPPAFETHT